MRPSGIHHVAICVDDADAAKTFYCDVLGFTTIDTRPEEISAAGVRIDRIPHMPGAGQQAFLRDPAGNTIELNQPD